MSFLNLCPHDVTVAGRVIAPSGKSARVATVTSPAGEHDGVPLTVTRFGALEVVDNATKQVVLSGLPEPVDGVILIVSGFVRAAAPDRKDIASPGQQFRDADGKVIGGKSLDVNP